MPLHLLFCYSEVARMFSFFPDFAVKLILLRCHRAYPVLVNCWTYPILLHYRTTSNFKKTRKITLSYCIARIQPALIPCQTIPFLSTITKFSISYYITAALRLKLSSTIKNRVFRHQKTHESSRLGRKAVFGSRLHSACYSLSYNLESLTPHYLISSLSYHLWQPEGRTYSKFYFI